MFLNFNQINTSLRLKISFSSVLAKKDSSSLQSHIAYTENIWWTLVEFIDIFHHTVILTCFITCYRDAVSLRSHHLFVDMPVGAMFELKGFYMVK